MTNINHTDFKYCWEQKYMKQTKLCLATTLPQTELNCFKNGGQQGRLRPQRGRKQVVTEETSGLSSVNKAVQQGNKD